MYIFSFLFNMKICCVFSLESPPYMVYCGYSLESPP